MQSSIHPIQKTPIQERIDYHLACLEARKHGHPDPIAPWNVPDKGTSRPTPAGDSLGALAMPEHRSYIQRDLQPAQKETPMCERKAARSASPSEKQPRPVEGRFRVTVDRPLPSSPRPLPASTKTPATPLPKPMTLVKEKEVLVDSLMLRAGVPKYIIRDEGRVRSVMSAFSTYQRQGGETSQTALVQKFEIARPFLTSGMSNFVKLAEAVIPLLAAESVQDLTNARLTAEEFLDTGRSHQEKGTLPIIPVL